MPDDARSDAALMLYSYLARQDEAERVARFYRERDSQGASKAMNQNSAILAPKPLTQPTRMASQVPPHIAAERVRARAIIALALVGFENERDEAIRTGKSAARFAAEMQGELAARAIIESRKALGAETEKA